MNRIYHPNSFIYTFIYKTLVDGVEAEAKSSKKSVKITPKTFFFLHYHVKNVSEIDPIKNCFYLFSSFSLLRFSYKVYVFGFCPELHRTHTAYCLFYVIYNILDVGYKTIFPCVRSNISVMIWWWSKNIKKYMC